jgi:hypothetical protein
MSLSGLSSARLRMIGRLVLALGIAGAGLYYGIAIRTATPTEADLLPGYAQAETRQIGILFGNSGVIMADWMDFLTRPSSQAVMIALASAAVSALCFHAARLHDAEDSDSH